MPSPLSNKYLGVVTFVVIVQAMLFYTASGSERTPLAAPLTAFSKTLGDWHMVLEGVVDKDQLEILKADDTLFRVYADDKRRANADLFIAYFQTQRTGQAPHSPKNCLPGSGWQPEENDVVDVPVSNEIIRINHFVVSKGEEKRLVYYWYQSQGRAIAGEFAAKFYLISDSIRKHRSDTSLVRVTIGVPLGRDDAAKAAVLDLVRSVYPAVKAYLPQ